MRIGILVFMAGVIIFEIGTFLTNRDQDSRLNKLEAATYSAQHQRYAIPPTISADTITFISSGKICFDPTTIVRR